MKGSPVYLPEASQLNPVRGIARVIRAFATAPAEEEDTFSAPTPSGNGAKRTYFVDKTKAVPRGRGIDAMRRVMHRANTDDE